MAVGTWRGVDNVARKVKKEWRGVGNVARNIKAEWRGVGNVARKVFQNELVIFENGAFQNGFGLNTGQTGVGNNTAFISGSALRIPYHSSADGVCGLILPSSFNANGFSKLHFDLQFNTVSYDGKYTYPGNTDYAWYFMGVALPNVTGSYGYDILDDYATNRLTITLPLSPKNGNNAYFYPRCGKSADYAATPDTYIYRIWLE